MLAESLSIRTLLCVASILFAKIHCRTLVGATWRSLLLLHLHVDMLLKCHLLWLSIVWPLLLWEGYEVCRMLVCLRTLYLHLRFVQCILLLLFLLSPCLLCPSPPILILLLLLVVLVWGHWCLLQSKHLVSSLVQLCASCLQLSSSALVLQCCEPLVREVFFPLLLLVGLHMMLRWLFHLSLLSRGLHWSSSLLLVVLLVQAFAVVLVVLMSFVSSSGCCLFGNGSRCLLVGLVGAVAIGKSTVVSRCDAALASADCPCCWIVSSVVCVPAVACCLLAARLAGKSIAGCNTSAGVTGVHGGALMMSINCLSYFAGSTCRLIVLVLMILPANDWFSCHCVFAKPDSVVESWF